mmetsp:Transcript_1838/g.4181  ORF Transcript_1838/g.4181 Transcript_1838/m.4181 type:complete len:124 (-) Transcript_1838:729-1100(-)
MKAFANKQWWREFWVSLQSAGLHLHAKPDSKSKEVFSLSNTVQVKTDLPAKEIMPDPKQFDSPRFFIELVQKKADSIWLLAQTQDDQQLWVSAIKRWIEIMISQQASGVSPRGSKDTEKKIVN